MSWRQEEELQESVLDLPDHHILMGCGGLGGILHDAYEDGAEPASLGFPECAVLTGMEIICFLS